MTWLKKLIERLRMFFSKSARGTPTLLNAPILSIQSTITGGGSLNITITRSGNSAACSCKAYTQNGTSNAFTPLNGVLVDFGVGENIKTVQVTISNSAVSGTNFSVVLGNPTNCVITNKTCLVTVQPQGSVSVVSVSSPSATEGGQLNYLVTLSGTTTILQTFGFVVSSISTATSAVDYNTSPILNNGVTLGTNAVNVPIGVSSFNVIFNTIDDVLVENAETLILSVGGITGTGTINDNETPSLLDSGYNVAIDNYFTGNRVWLNLVRGAGFYASANAYKDSNGWLVNFPNGEQVQKVVRKTLGGSTPILEAGNYKIVSTTGVTNLIDGDIPGVITNVSSAPNLTTFTVNDIGIQTNDINIVTTYNNNTGGNVTENGENYKIYNVAHESDLNAGYITTPYFRQVNAGQKYLRWLDSLRANGNPHCKPSTVPSLNIHSYDYETPIEAIIKATLEVNYYNNQNTVAWLPIPNGGGSRRFRTSANYIYIEDAEDEGIYDNLPYANGDRVYVGLGFGTPSVNLGLTNKVYYVINADTAQKRFQISLTNGGAAVTFATATREDLNFPFVHFYQSPYAFFKSYADRAYPVQISINGNVRTAANNLKLKLTAGNEAFNFGGIFRRNHQYMKEAAAHLAGVTDPTAANALGVGYAYSLGYLRQAFLDAGFSPSNIEMVYEGQGANINAVGAGLAYVHPTTSRPIWQDVVGYAVSNYIYPISPTGKYLPEGTNYPTQEFINEGFLTLDDAGVASWFARGIANEKGYHTVTKAWLDANYPTLKFEYYEIGIDLFTQRGGMSLTAPQISNVSAVHTKLHTFVTSSQYGAAVMQANALEVSIPYGVKTHMQYWDFGGIENTVTASNTQTLCWAVQQTNFGAPSIKRLWHETVPNIVLYNNIVTAIVGQGDVAEGVAMVFAFTVTPAAFDRYVTFSLSGQASITDYSTITANNGVIIVSRTIKIPANVSSFNMSIATIDDATLEFNETITVTCNGISASNAILFNDGASGANPPYINLQSLRVTGQGFDANATFSNSGRDVQIDFVPAGNNEIKFYFQSLHTAWAANTTKKLYAFMAYTAAPSGMTGQRFITRLANSGEVDYAPTTGDFPINIIEIKKGATTITNPASSVFDPLLNTDSTYGEIVEMTLRNDTAHNFVAGDIIGFYIRASNPSTAYSMLISEAYFI